jgi:hypothetical protein
VKPKKRHTSGSGTQSPVDERTFRVTKPSNLALPRAVNQLGAAASVLIVLCTLFDIAASWSAWHSYQSLRDYDTGTATIADLQAADQVSAIVVGCNLALTVAAAITFIGWLWRARANAENLSIAVHRHRRGWVIGAWFCPIINFIYPPRIIGDVWKTSRPGAAPTYDLDRLPGSRLIGWWWALYLLANLVERYGQTFKGTTATTPDDFYVIARDETIATVFTVGAAGLVIVIIRRISRWQHTPRHHAVPPADEPVDQAGDRLGDLQR